MSDQGFSTGHPNGFHIRFENGYTVSVQWNSTNYCSNRNLVASISEIANPENKSSATAEVAAWNSKDWVKLDDKENVIGWQTPAQVLEIMNRIAALPSNP